MVDLRRYPSQCNLGHGPGEGDAEPRGLRRFEPGVRVSDHSRETSNLPQEVRSADVTSMRPVIDEDAIGGLKFSECLPEHIAVEMLEHRLSDAAATTRILQQEARFIPGVLEID